MTLQGLAHRLTAQGRAQWVAAFAALLAVLPTLFTLPATDRDESRFAEASAQMLESGDFTNIMFQDAPRYKKPVGVYWLQAASARTLAGSNLRRIWAYRIPSVLGAMLAAAACAWGAMAFLEPGWAMMAGVLLGTTTALSTEAGLATTDAALCGAVTLAMAALARLYLAARNGPPAGRWTRALFWLGFAASVMLKGPIGPMVIGLTVIALGTWDRRIAWLKTIGWGWGLVLFCAVTLPWALAITVETDGGFWGAAVGGDLAPKLLGGQEGHGAPPGYYLALSPVLLFPATLLAPAAVVSAWRWHAEPAIRFALCWLVPSWLVFELVPTKLPHYTLPTFAAICWLMAASLRRPLGARVRIAGVVLLALVAAGFAAVGGYAAWAYGGWMSWLWVAIAAALLVATAIAGARFLLAAQSGRGAALACGLGLAAHSALVGGLAPTLGSLWLSQRAVEALAKAEMTPSQGLVEGPVAVAGYAEPSLVFALGASTGLGDADDAAEAITEGRPAIVEAKDEPAFRAGLAKAGVSARLAGQVSGLDYSTGHAQVLRIYEPPEPAS